MATPSRAVFLVLLLTACTRGLAPGRAPENPPAPPPPAPTAAAPRPPELRLPASVRPTRYALQLAVVPTERTFSGKVEIQLALSEATSTLWLHGKQLKVTGASVRAGPRTLAAKPIAAGDGFLGLSLEQPIGPGEATLSVSYEGVLDETRTGGLYRQEEGGDWYAYTFFEPIEARTAFPCFDEPGFKTPWRLTLDVREKDVALANAPVESETPLGKGMKRVVFAETPPLPSYLVAFIVGPFDLVDAGTAGRHGTPLRFAVPRGRGGETRYAAQVTPRIVTLLEDWFEIPYPFKKLDVAVVPRGLGTMEHPGLVALGQPLTLMNPGEDSLGRRQRYASTAVHELAHYWFGDYATMAWWDDTWLNEAFASWVEAPLTDQLEPSWNWLIEYRARNKSWAMREDSLPSTLPIRQPVQTQNDILATFDGSITYSKGASVIAMFESWLGRERFQKVVRKYLRDHAWGSVSARDWFAALEAEAGADVAAGFQSFLDQPGLPFVSASLRCEKGAPPKLALAQSRFVVGGTKEAESQTWKLPICVRYGAGAETKRTCTLLTGASAELPLEMARCPEWVMPNAGGDGYYRARYEPAALKALTADRGQKLSVPERISLVSDVSAEAQRGDLPLPTALTLAASLAGDSSNQVLEASVQPVMTVDPDKLPDDVRTRFARFLRKTYGARARALGWEPKPGEPDSARLLRPKLLRLVASAGEDEALAAQARKLAERWLNDSASVDGDVAREALFVAARNGDRALFERIRAEAKKANDRERRGTLLGALGVFRDPALVKAALDLPLSGEFDLREGIGPLWGSLMNPRGRPQAWDFYKKNFDTLAERLGQDYALGLLFVGASLCDEQVHAEAEAFLKDRAPRFPGGARAVASGLESSSACVAATQRNLPALKEFLAGY